MHILPASEQLPVNVNPFYCWQGDAGRREVLFYRLSEAYLIRHPGLVDFTLWPSNQKVSAVPVPSISDTTVEYIFNNQIQPLLSSAQGRLVLHGSAVASPDGALVFLAPSGTGKSTVASFLAGVGFPLLSDDAVTLLPGNVSTQVQPAFPGVRLWEDSLDALGLRGVSAQQGAEYSEKYQVAAGGSMAYCESAQPLCAVFLLSRGDGIDLNLKPLSGSEALVSVLRNSFFLSFDDRPKVVEHFARTRCLLGDTPVVELSYSTGYDQLADIAQRFANMDFVNMGPVAHPSSLHSP
ncbi:MAG: hypothetical protein V7720_12220 [Halioglobus sp.]